MLDFPRYKDQSAFMVSKYLNGEYGTLKEIGPELASMFYAIDRFDAKKETESLLATCDIVIANRYVSSNMIHQATKMDSYESIDRFLSWVYNLEYEVFGIPKPTCVIYLKISAHTSHKLIALKAEREYIKGGTNKDLHESDASHIAWAIGLAEYVAAKYTNWVVVDCEKDGEMLPRETITEMIASHV
jgi:dTMP kinase